MVCSGLTKEDKKFWDEIIAYFPLIWHGLHRKRRVQLSWEPMDYKPRMGVLAKAAAIYQTDRSTHESRQDSAPKMTVLSRSAALYPTDTQTQKLHDSQGHDTVKYGHESCGARNQEGLRWRKHEPTHRQQCNLINLLLFFFQNKESRLKIKRRRMRYLPAPGLVLLHVCWHHQVSDPRPAIHGRAFLKPFAPTSQDIV
jgi:hypothetical protein